MYALVDCNNFFVSCERIFNPALNGRPVVVLSGNDGCVIARSNEAKALGIAMGNRRLSCESFLNEIMWLYIRLIIYCMVIFHGVSCLFCRTIRPM